MIRCQPLVSGLSRPMSGGGFGAIFGKLILNHPIITVLGTIALPFVVFRSVTASFEPGASQMLILVQPTWRYVYTFTLMIYGVFLAFQFHRVVKKERHEVIAVSWACSIALTAIGSAFALAYYMPLVARIGLLATAVTLPLVVWMAVRSRAATGPAQ